MNRYIFDVDGTLTPSRGKMDPEFKEFFLEFAKTHPVFLVTGSDYPKTLEQVGSEVTESVACVYNCSGSDTWFKGKRVSCHPFKLPLEVEDLLNGWLAGSKFPIRTGNHIEKRMGLVNFSVVGRNATKEQREEYAKYDMANRERESIAYDINTKFGDTTRASVGGETGIDIHAKGADKSQILVDFDPDSPEIHFFGDAMHEGGNDYPLARANKRGKNYHVKDWQDTWTKLLIIQSIESEEYE